ncbi:hypothetical protein [Micromonospora inositola]|uniref:hypothetical protein n=1 Tax=Micromonospora inositola TaxID=47865 RepID=UPI000B5AC183|nr:hypothetical protein [Micromonospora inositola]
MTLRSVDDRAARELGHRLGDGHAAIAEVEVAAPQTECFPDPQPAVGEDRDQEVIRRRQLGHQAVNVLGGEDGRVRLR